MQYISLSADLVDEGVKIYKIIDNDLLHLEPVHISSKLVQLYHVFHQKHCIQLQLSFVTNERVLYNYNPFRWSILYFLVFIRFCYVVY